MKIPHIRLTLIVAMASAILISACTTEATNPSTPINQPKPAAPEPVAPPPPEPESAEQLAEKAARANAQAELDSGIALYNNGDYRGAIKRFSVIYDNLKPYKEMELQALKFSAFSYCVSGHTPMCKQQFEKAVKLDPSFDLEPGEKGHPLWGPVFDRVKKENH